MRNVILDMQKEYPLLNDIKFDSTNFEVKYLFKYMELDFDIYLEKYGCNLQRPFVWTIEQSEAYIQSLVLERYIPPFLASYGSLSEGKKLYIIDGKQRLMSLKKYLDNEYPVRFGRQGSFYFDELNKDEQSRIIHKNPVFKLAYDMKNDRWKLTDDEFIEVFNFFNFGGTPQDVEHMNKLMSLRS